MMSNAKLKKNKKGEKQHTPLKLTNLPNNKGTKRKAQLMLTNSPNFKIAPVHEKYLRTKMLLTDTIYGCSIPDNALGKYFLYTVDSYDNECGEFTVKY